MSLHYLMNDNELAGEYNLSNTKMPDRKTIFTILAVRIASQHSTATVNVSFPHIQFISLKVTNITR